MWKDIKGWEEYYEINENGEVKNKITKKILKGDVNNCGYHRVCLYKKNHIPIKQRFFVHRLVAEHFIQNINSLPEVNHIDGNKHNNHVDNLEWVSRSENEIHARKNNLKHFKPNSRFKIYKILIEFLDGTIKIFNSQTECSKQLGVSHETIKRMINHPEKSMSIEKLNIKNIKYI